MYARLGNIAKIRLRFALFGKAILSHFKQLLCCIEHIRAANKSQIQLEYYVVSQINANSEKCFTNKLFELIR